MTVPIVLTIAGSDSGAGAGIQADLKTFAAFGVYGVSVLTAVTAQNTLKVSAVQELSLEMVQAQLEAIAEDFEISALKTGMLSSADIIDCVVDGIRRLRLRPLVVDPVMVAKSNDRLLRADAVDALREKLIPLAEVVTPNIPEAEVLWGRPIHSREDRVLAGKAILGLGARAVVVKGGHSTEDPVVDLLISEGGVAEFSAPRIKTTSTHGTGCTFSAAIAAGLGSGLDIPAAVEQARRYLTATLTSAPAIGHGHGPLNHFPGRQGWVTDRRTAHVLQ
jgi:hydroxymethylpyrimidine/phosphomethylpyrimidine kinase